MTMARSRDLFGPYEVHPDGPVLTARDTPDAPLQRTGHGDLVETPDGETWMAYLCGRPLPASNRCVLGRETAIQRMEWGADGWLRCAEPTRSRLTLRRSRHSIGSTARRFPPPSNGCARPSPSISSA